MGHHGCGRNCFARSHDPAYGLYAASRVRFAGLQKTQSALDPAPRQSAADRAMDIPIPIALSARESCLHT